ncbi:MAG: hypothetical protein FJZ78_09035 [Bacteroidetes bacterium]|nr:hypothetical protein [Bacteroidota bacterium]
MERKVTLRRLSRWSLILFFTIAGTNHFITPESYYPLIPDYLREWDKLINVVSGLAEIGFAVLLLQTPFRKVAGWGLIFLLVAFIPSHIHFIQKGNLTLGPFTITPTIAWIRLILVHPLLVLWVWWTVFTEERSK